MTDRTTGEVRWKPISAAGTMFAHLLQPGFNNVNPNQPIFVAPGMMQANPEPQPTPRFSYMTLGHLAVVPVGNIVVGIDAATGRESVARTCSTGWTGRRRPPAWSSPGR